MDCQDGSRAGFWSIKRQVQVLDADYPVQKKPSPGNFFLIFKLFQFTSKYFNLPINFGIFSISTIIKYIGVVPQLSSAKMNHRGTSCTHYHDWLGYHEL